MGINKWISKYIRKKKKDRRIYETDDNNKLSSEVELTHIPASEGQGKEREAEGDRREREARRGRKRQKKGIGR